MYHISIQYAIEKKLAPAASLLRKWAKIALKKLTTKAELTIRIVDIEEITQLNKQYRQKNYPTNILSFPLDLPQHVELTIPLLGDIVICAAIVNQEAKEQNKPLVAHWAHMITHGVFHLLGLNHETAQQAEIMERLEIETMQQLGFNNPYAQEEENE